MARRITGFLREYMFGFSILVMIAGFIILLMGIIWYSFKDSENNLTIQLGFYTDTIQDLGDWNAYLFVIGFIIFAFGVWYLYSYLKNRKFVLEELRTNKRSELLKKHNELKDTVRQLPSKYKKMLAEKEKELRIK